MTQPAVFRLKGQSYTCILVTEGAKFVYFVPMSSLQLEKAESREFYTEWEEYKLYPARRAAQLYLSATQYREMSPKAREHLEAIVADPATAFDPARILPQSKEETDMNAPTKQPATSKSTKASAAPAKTNAASPTAPAKKAAASKVAPNGMDTVVKQTAAATKTAPTKQAAVKTAPTKQATPAAKTPAAKTPAKGDKQAAPAAKTAPVARAAPNADQKLKVAEPDKPRRGVTQDFVNEAVKLKTFTRQQLLDKMVAKGHDAKAARIKIADCVYFEVFAAA